MTVAELIKALEELDPTLPVMTGMPKIVDGLCPICKPRPIRVLLNYRKELAPEAPHIEHNGSDWINADGEYAEIQAVLL